MGRWVGSEKRGTSARARREGSASRRPGGERGQQSIVRGMVVAAFVAPYLLDATRRFVDGAASLPDVELALITCEPEERVPRELRRGIAGHWRIDDPLDAGQIAVAVEGLGGHLGPVRRLLAVLEQLQVPLGRVR